MSRHPPADNPLVRLSPTAGRVAFPNNDRRGLVIIDPHEEIGGLVLSVRV